MNVCEIKWRTASGLFEMHWSASGSGWGCGRHVVHRMNESVLGNRGLAVNAKKCACELVFVPTALYDAEAWYMRSVK